MGNDTGVPSQDITSVNPSTGQRVMTTIGNILSSSTGQDPNSNPLNRAIKAHQQRQLDTANMYRQTAATHAAALLMAHQGIDPENGMRFDDPNYQGPGQQAQVDKFTGNYQEALN